jgi:hypothetical protein
MSKQKIISLPNLPASVMEDDLVKKILESFKDKPDDSVCIKHPMVPIEPSSFPKHPTVLRHPCYQTYPCQHKVLFPDGKTSCLSALEIVEKGYHKHMSEDEKSHFDEYDKPDFKERM